MRRALREAKSEREAQRRGTMKALDKCLSKPLMSVDKIWYDVPKANCTHVTMRMTRTITTTAGMTIATTIVLSLGTMLTPSDVEFAMENSEFVIFDQSRATRGKIKILLVMSLRPFNNALSCLLSSRSDPLYRPSSQIKRAAYTNVSQDQANT